MVELVDREDVNTLKASLLARVPAWVLKAESLVLSDLRISIFDSYSDF